MPPEDAASPSPIPWLRRPLADRRTCLLLCPIGIPSSRKGAEPSRPSSPCPQSRLSLLAGTPLLLSPETMEWWKAVEVSREQAANEEIRGPGCPCCGAIARSPEAALGLRWDGADWAAKIHMQEPGNEGPRGHGERGYSKASPGLQRARSVASPFLGGLAEKYLATWSRKPPGCAILTATPPSFFLLSSCRWHLSPRSLSLSSSVRRCEGVF